MPTLGMPILETNTSFLHFCFNFDSFASDKLEVVQFAQASAMIFFDYSEDIWAYPNLR